MEGKLCSSCKQPRPWTAFNRSAKYAMNLYYRCKDCQNAYMRANRTQNIETRRQYDREKMRRYRKAGRPQRKKPVDWRAQIKCRYGITVEEHDRLLAEQNYACAICRVQDSATHKGLYIDHDHKRNVVRGLLCASCNWAAGHLRDSPALARRLAEYLETAQAREGGQPSE